ncbi:YqgE/AlgH family protein [Myxococcota bacterium]|nr:YqgE/AlgH family protein [Myxococcota bacterium]
MVEETELVAPALLLAVPHLADPNFNRGVILLIEHNEEGSMGLLLNRDTDLNLFDFFDSQDMDYKGDGSALIRSGGPVQTDRAFLLHASGHEGPETEDVFENTRLSYSLESLGLLVAAPPARWQIYLGYSGWGPDQLAEEVMLGAWMLAPADEKYIYDVPPTKVWEGVLADMGIDPLQLIHSGALN